MALKLAIISDLHGDAPALDLALARIRAMGCDHLVCAGDLVDGDAFPDEVIARLIAEKVPTIRGNHDRWALERVGRAHPGQRRRKDPRRDGASLLYQDESAVFGGGMELSPESMRFLGELPTSLTLYLEGVRVVVWHASVKSDMDGIYPGETPPGRLPGPCRRPAPTSCWWATRTRRSACTRREAWWPTLERSTAAG